MIEPSHSDANALTVAGLSIDGLVPLHSEVAEPWPADVRRAAVQLLDRTSECSQVALRAHAEDDEAGEELNFQNQLQVQVIGVAKTAAVVAGSPSDDEATRTFAARIFETALDGLDYPLLRSRPLEDHTMLVDATRLAAWSGATFRKCCAYEEASGSDVDRARAQDDAVSMLITLGVAGLQALAASMLRDGSVEGGASSA